MQTKIHVKGAREHNLKNLELSIPRDAITVVTGPSGSGKSSLAIDTIYAEGQRRYVESLSPYSRQFLEQMQKPDVDSIEGLSPSVAIDQKTVSRSPRSTLGTITEIYDYLRVLYTRLGKPFCYKCNVEIAPQEAKNILTAVLSLPEGTRIQILSPIIRDRKGNYRKELQEMRSEGFVRARIDGVMEDLTQNIILAKQKRHTIEIVIDRLIVKKRGIERQISDSIETAFKYTDSLVINLINDNKDILFSKTAACPKCGISYPDIVPRFFSFNSTAGACPKCNGLGFESVLEEIVDLDDQKLCRECRGLRLKKESLSVRFSGLNIAEFSRMSVDQAITFLRQVMFTEREKTIASRILKEINDRLFFLSKVGIGYLTLDRPSLTLSGGESQRVRLATQMGSSLTGVLYVLDEPSIGLHPRDCGKLLESLSAVKNAGNTVIIVEHDEETIRWADHIIDMGPGAGTRGGWIVAAGTPAEIEKNIASLTGRYLSRKIRIEIPAQRRKAEEFIVIHGASEHNLKNIDIVIPLKTFTCVTGVSGSGKSTLVFDILQRAAAKVFSKGLPGVRAAGAHRTIAGLEMIDKVISVDQSPIGRTPRSNPATYTGFFGLMRDIFALVPEAKKRGYPASRFSFNIEGGRCESCRGNGLIKVEMHFLPDVYVRCDKCKGERYNDETLEIKYRDKNIAELLDMTVSDALIFFENIPLLRRKLEMLEEIGLGYIQLGQSATTLSGGESQRIRLSKELGKRATGNTLYILDEPTTGLHFVDIQRLLDVINMLVDRGNTVVVIEHNLDVIKSADFIIDLGPEGGDQGGEVLATGTPEEVSLNPASYTGRFLTKCLGAG
jgi:excinuclease ABC subunit A